MNEQTNAQTNDRSNEQTNDQSNEQTNDQSNDRSNEQTNSRPIALVGASFLQPGADGRIVHRFERAGTLASISIDRPFGLARARGGDGTDLTPPCLVEAGSLLVLFVRNDGASPVKASAGILVEGEHGDPAPPLEVVGPALMDEEAEDEPEVQTASLTAPRTESAPETPEASAASATTGPPSREVACPDDFHVALLGRSLAEVLLRAFSDNAPIVSGLRWAIVASLEQASSEPVHETEDDVAVLAPREVMEEVVDVLRRFAERGLPEEDRVLPAAVLTAALTRWTDGSEGVAQVLRSLAGRRAEERDKMVTEGAIAGGAARSISDVVGDGGRSAVAGA